MDTTELLVLLAAIQDSGAIAQAARSMGLSYRHAWGQVKRAEELSGHPLADAGRGRGSTLTPLAVKLIWADKRIAARLSPLLSSLASELEHELERATLTARFLNAASSAARYGMWPECCGRFIMCPRRH